MINWVTQLNNSQLENSFISLLEKNHVLSFPNQPNPICDRSGIPDDTERVFVDKRKTSLSHEIDDKRLHIELFSSDRTGKPVKLSEDIRVMHVHDGTGEPVKSSASTHTVEEFVPAEHRDIASFNADNEFNLATDEENIDFNIPRVPPNSTVKRPHGVNVQNLIQKIEIHSQRQALQSDLQQHRPFNPFSKESPDVIKAAGNTELCELLDVEPKAQCKACLAYWDAGIVYCTCGHFLRDDTAVTQEIVGNRLQEELGSSDRTGKPVKCEDNRVMNVHDRTGKPVESSTHTVQEFDSPGHRDTASSNADKFNLAMDDENIDFNISGVPNAMVKRSHGVNVHNFIHKIENHPHQEGPTTRSQVREERRLQRISKRQNTFKRGVERNNTKTFTIDLSVTSSSERPCSNWVALKRSSLKWIDLQAKTTVILPQKKKLMSTVVIGGSVRIW